MSPNEEDGLVSEQVPAIDVDSLGHNELATFITEDLTSLAPTSVLSIQGSWGQGKTDVVRRVFDRISTDEKFPEPIWINPWQYGTPDLIRPVVVQILQRMAPDRRNASDRVRRAARTLLRAANAMMFKAISVLAPFGEIIAAGEDQVDDFLQGLFDDKAKVESDTDPVHAMATRFRELVEEYLKACNKGQGKLIVCIDDLDRCLPDHQIAMLEAIYFLIGAEARCSFVIALDPVLVRQAARAHYKTDGFDSEQYLNKLFTFRLNLPPLEAKQIYALVRNAMDQDVGRSDTLGNMLARQYSRTPEAVSAVFARCLCVPELTNPRLIRRIIERVGVLTRRLDTGDGFSNEDKSYPLDSVVVWAAISERWPTVRESFQQSDPTSWLKLVELICLEYGFYERQLFSDSPTSMRESRPSAQAFFSRLPAKEKSPDLGSFLLISCLREQFLSVPMAAKIDNMMIRAGV